MQPPAYLDGDMRSFPDGDRSPKRRRAVWGLILFAVAAGTASIVGVVMLRDRPPSGGHVALPPIQGDAGVTRAYLQTTDGQLIRSIAAVGSDVVRAGDVAQCATAIDRLESIGTFTDVLAAIEAIPDRDTAAMALNQLDDLSFVLGRCLNDQRFPDRADLEFTQAVLDRRLQELS